MGWLKRLNQARKTLDRTKEPRSAGIIRELEQFYEEHPKATLMVSNAVAKIREEGEVVFSKLQEDFDRQQEEATCLFVQRELDYVKSFIFTPKT